MSLRNLPSVEFIKEKLVRLHPDLPDLLCTEIARQSIRKVREKIRGSKQNFSREELEQTALAEANNNTSSFRRRLFIRVINATGTILHTGLGRAPLNEDMLHEIIDKISPYTNLELDLETGTRGQRLNHTDKLLQLITGAESSAVVNNNAAAVLLSLNTLSDRKEVIVSRGQLVEIGGSFRIPEVINKSGAIMVEVGTTNKTHLSDFERALNPETGAILITHTSNFEIHGFTAFPEIDSIIQLAHRHQIPVLYDLGSGAFLDLERFGLPHEPVVNKMINADFDVVTFSGDKLLGSVQSGILVGKKIYLDKIRSNPLMRAVRCDKLTLAILEQTLLYYLSDHLNKIPFYSMLFRSVESLRKEAESLLKGLEIPGTCTIEIVPDGVQIGSGACPVYKHPGIAISIKSTLKSDEEIAAFFRNYDPPVLGRIEKGNFLLSMTTLTKKDMEPIRKCLQNFFSELSH